VTSAERHDGQQACSACGRLTAPGQQHCGSCGWNLAGDGDTEQVHNVTVVVSDLQGSTALAEGLDPETLRLVLDRYFDELGAVLEAYGGRTEKRIGDMMVTVFGLGRPGLDDAVNALAAVAEAQQTLASLNDRLQQGWGVRLVNRTGVASGEVRYVAAGGTHRVLAGPAIETASALEPVAPALEALVDTTTAAAAGSAVELGPITKWTNRHGELLVAQQLERILAPSLDPERTAAMVDECTSCRRHIGSDDQWCTGCGMPLARRGRLEDRRRHVTIVFADLRLDTEPSRTADDVQPAAHRAALVEVFDVVRRALERHGGVVEKFIGDAVMAVFGLDRRHEDDAVRAVRAALEVQSQLEIAAPGLADRFGVVADVRIGVNTGPVVAGDPDADQRLVTGDAVNVAARLEQTARPGAVVVGALTHTLLGPAASSVALKPLELKGKSAPVAAHRVWSVDGTAVRHERFDLPFVGRDAELASLHRAWSDTRAAASWHRVDLVGEAGVGKSRLLREFFDQLDDDTRVLRGVCPSYGEGITFLPITEIVRQLAGVALGDPPEVVRAALAGLTPDPDVAAVLGSMLGVEIRVAPVGEVFWAVRRALETAAAITPLVVVVDGLHHGEPTLRDLLDDLVQHGGQVPVLMVCMERADIVEDEEDSGTVLHLGPLDPVQCDELIRYAVGDATLPADLAGRIVGASSGVPLFVEQLLAALVDDGRLVRFDDSWQLTAPVDLLEVPATAEAVVAARIDTLDPTTRHTLETAAVVGREFSVDGVAFVGRGLAVQSDVTMLAERHFVRPVEAEDVLVDHRFSNLLLRDVAYNGLLKRRRSELHRRYGDWMVDGPSAPRLVEVEELVGYHLEQAYALGVEVGLVDEDVVESGRRAAQHLGAAGERAFVRGDMPAAANLLHRAAATLHTGGAEASRLLVLAGDASFEQGAFDVALDRYDRAAAQADAIGDPVRAAHAELALTTRTYLLEGGEAVAVRNVVDRLDAEFLAHDDPAGLARCSRLRAYVELTGCQWGAVAAAASTGIEAARRAGDLALERRLLPALAGASLYGPTEVLEALAQCKELLASPTVDRRGTTLIRLYSGHLLALAGEFDEARRLCDRTRVELRDLGWHYDAALVSIHLGPIELLAGHSETAEKELRADFDALTEMGDQNYLATTAYLLAEAVRQQGRTDEALELANLSADMADEDDLTSQAGWRGVVARVRCATGDLATALGLATEVLGLLSPTDDLVARSEAHLDLAEVHNLLGDIDIAVEHATAARSLAESKGSVPGMTSAQEMLDALSSG